MRHPHADLIKEWAEDTSRVVQYKSIADCKWHDFTAGDPMFNRSIEWRFKPEPKPDVVRYAKVDQDGYTSEATLNRDGYDNLKLTFDGETGKLKSAEVIE